MKIFDWKKAETWSAFLGKKEGQTVISDREAVKEFVELFTHVKTYHACRPENVATYFEKGLVIQSRQKLLDTYSDQMVRYFGIEIPATFLEKARKELQRISSEGEIFVVLDDYYLTEFAGCTHYATYGSEYILSIARFLKTRFCIAGDEYLIRIGTPSIYEIHLPISHLCEDDLLGLVGKINDAIVNDEIASVINFTFAIREPIGSECVVGVRHPEMYAP